LLILAAGLLLGTASVADAFPPYYRPHHQPIPVVTPGAHIAPSVYVAPQAYSLSPFRYPYYGNPYYGAGFRYPSYGVGYGARNYGFGYGARYYGYPFASGWSGGGIYNPFALGWYGGFGGFGYSPGFFYNVDDPSGGNLFYSYPGYYFWSGSP
jgi:hypothetical protein